MDKFTEELRQRQHQALHGNLAHLMPLGTDARQEHSLDADGLEKLRAVLGLTTRQP